jgi:hypothetical protein
VYSRFHDKIGVLHCLQDRFVEEAHLTTDVTLDPDRWDGAGIDEIVGELVAFLVQVYREGGGVLVSSGTTRPQWSSARSAWRRT